MENTLLLDLVITILGEPRKRNDSTQQYSFNCPVCSAEKGVENDEKYNLEVNLDKNVFRCWSCYEINSTHGSLYKLVKNFGNKKQLSQLYLLEPESKPKRGKSTQDVIYLPKDYVSFKDGQSLHIPYKEAINYLHKRGLSDDIIFENNLGYCENGPYAHRIIIPSYDKNNKLNYFVSRSYIGDKLKYKNPKVEKELIIFNENKINWKDPIYLAEGVFDSLFLPNSIPMLGKKLSDILWKELYEKAESDIILCLDGDAWTNSEEIYHKLNGGKLRGRIKAIKLPSDKDIAELKGVILPEYIKEQHHFDLC